MIANIKRYAMRNIKLKPIAQQTAELKSYDVKGWDGKNWHYLGKKYLNAYDTQEQKLQVIKALKKEFGSKYSFNISNFFNVYC